MSFIKIIPNIIVMLEFLTVLVVLMFWKKLNSMNAPYFFFAVVLTLFVELLGSMDLLGLFKIAPQFLYISYGVGVAVVAPLLYSFFLKGELHSSQTRKTFTLVQVVYVMVALVMFIALKGFSLTQSIDYWTSLFIIIVVFIFYRELIRLDRVFGLQHYFAFWVSIGLVLYYTCSIPLFLVNLIISLSTYRAILLILNVFLYGPFIIGALWTKSK